MTDPMGPKHGEPTPPPQPPPDGAGDSAPPPSGWLVGDSGGEAPPPQEPSAEAPAPQQPDAWNDAPPPAPPGEAPPEPATEYAAPAPAWSPPPPEPMDRRSFLSRASSIAMGAGLVSSYGAFAAMAGRFLYPARPALKGWLFVIEVAAMKPGASLTYTAPDGATIAVARQGLTGQVSDFIALSSTCPHLGCKVHWEGQNQRFFCPCHNGAFDPSGKATAGPPAEAGQSLGKYPLRVENGLLYIEVPLEGLPGPEEA